MLKKNFFQHLPKKTMVYPCATVRVQVVARRSSPRCLNANLTNCFQLPFYLWQRKLCGEIEGRVVI